MATVFNIYENDILARFAGHTLNKTTNVDVITWTLKDGGNNFVQKYDGLDDTGALRQLRINLGFPDSVLLLSTTTQRNALSSVDDGQTIFNTTDNEAQTFDGTVWASGGGGLGYTLTWGANLQTTGRYAQTNGITSGGQETGLSAGSQHIVPATGTLNCATYNSGTGDATTVYKIWKNGAVAHTFTATGSGGKEENIGLAVVVGVDRIAIEYDAGMKPAGCILVAYII